MYNMDSQPWRIQDNGRGIHIISCITPFYNYLDFSQYCELHPLQHIYLKPQ